MKTVLVVDDRPADRDLLSTVLGYAGYDVLEAGSAEDALRLARSRQPDLIVTDLLMPDVSGYEFVRELRADPVIGQTRVIFCTATYAEEEVRRLAEASGVAQVLVKPCEPQDIVRAVRDVLGSNGAHPSAEIVPDQFDREQLRVLNDKLLEKVDELEQASSEQRLLHEELLRAERQTAESLTLLETLLSAAPVGLAFVDRDFRLVRANAVMAGALPVSMELGRRLSELMPAQWRRIERLFRQVLETGSAVVNEEVQLPATSPDGQPRVGLASYYPVRLNDEGIGIGIVVVDVTESRQADDFRSVVMETMAEGLYATDSEDHLMFMNPAASRVLGWTEEELRGLSVHAKIHFQHGDGTPLPEEESELLKVLSEGRTVRVADDAFTRKDGSIVPVAYSAAPLLSGTAVRGGVVVFRDTTGEKAEEIRIKRELAALAWVGRIRDALDEDRLVLFSQPIVPINGGRRSEELLVRMIGPRGEIIAPRSFLPVAEKYKLIGEIDQWVLRQGLTLAATGRHVHLNLSADSITSPELLVVVERVLSETGADPSNVVFEITETALMSDVAAGEACTRGLGELGFGMALDDFGTGYGGFTYLQTLPIDYLKLDISFVRELPSNPANQHVVKAIVNLAEGFGQQTVAEGVEDAETLALLAEFGIDFAQGFHLGRPAPLVD